ncbi:hypothetical protein PybrP1_010065 [[Pythium] brassicae (nom. inval.)]|nr:hypothetical protein PybrP1_010065 [[Pythium] brassicae (nom. inval.)]
MARPKGKGKKGAAPAAAAKPKKATAPQKKRKASAAAAATGKSVARDVYSDDDDDDAQEEKRNAKMDIDGVYEYEQPETFEHDSEIDEDEAFDSDDEQAYGSFFRSKPAKQGAKSAEYSDDDNEEEGGEDAAGGDLLSDLLGTAPATRLSTRKDDADTDDADDSALENSDDEDAGEPKNLSAIADGLVPERKKKKLTEISLDGVAAAAASSELTLSALLGGVDADAATGDNGGLNLSKVKKQVRDLAADGGAALQAAVAPVLEERATRQLAYAQKKQDVDLFQPVVRRNRQKETMDFREQTPKLENLTAASLTSKFSAQTALEKDVAALLQAGDVSDKAIAKGEQEELAQLQVSTAEVAQRQQELAKLRALLFYAEQKQKRVKKIKSKLYHKIRNSQDKKQAEKQRQQLRALDPELADQLERELAAQRAEERMTLKHTNTSKWVKHQLQRGTLADKGTRGAIAEQLRRGDELRRKVHAAGSDDEGEEGDEDDEDDDGDDEGGADAAMRLQQRLEKRAGALVLEIGQDEAVAGQATGLAGMKFMQRAVQKQREKARTEAEKLLRELKGGGGDDGLLSDGDALSSGDEATTTTANSKKPKNQSQKKKKAAGKKSVAATEADKQAVANALPTGALQTGSVSMDRGLSARASGAIAVDLGDGGAGKRQAAEGGVATAATAAAGQTIELGAKAAKRQGDSKAAVAVAAMAVATESAAPAENPWLSTASAATKSKKRNKKNSAGRKDQSGATVASAIESLSKAVAKDAAAAASAAGSALSLLTGGGGATDANANSSSKKRKLEQSAAGADGSRSASSEATTKKAKASAGSADGGAKQATQTQTQTTQKIPSIPSKPTQEELVRRAFAFAGEDEDELAREKEQLAAQDADAKKGAEVAKLIGMSGWGSWAGDGVKQSFRHKARVERAQQLAATAKTQALAGRKDARMARVLISEKKDKRAARFAVQDVPYPFTSREEYEMAMRNPLGSDWNTPAATSALTAPGVIKRAGAIIAPLKLTKADKKEAKKELSKQRKAKF